MGLRFRKSFKIAPGVKINLNKKSTSVTFGGKGLHHTISSTGKRTTSAGIPGTGLYYTQTSGSAAGRKTPPNNSNSVKSPNHQNQHNTEKWYKKTGWIIFFLIIFSPIGLFLMWKYRKDWGTKLKTALSVVFAIWFIAMATSAANQSTEPSKNNPQQLVSETGTKEETESQTEYEVAETESQTMTESESQTEVETEPTPVIETELQTETEPPVTETESQTEYVAKVWINDTGKKYHSNPNCSRMKGAYKVTEEEATSMGKEACKKCY